MTKTWKERFESSVEPVVKVLDKPFGGMTAGQRMLISSPMEIDAHIRAMPPGTQIDVAQLRLELAHKHDADGTCPLTTGIFVRIVSELALERMAGGNEDVTPFWRVVDPRSPLARKKLSCGPEPIARLRAEEADEA